MKKTLISIFAIALLMTVSSCSKEEEEDTTDTEAPKITIVSPTTSDSYMSGDEVHLEFDVTENDEIHEIEGYLIKESMGVIDTVWSDQVHSHGTEYTMHGHYTIGTVMHADFSVIVIASDHSGNESTETFAFHVMQ